MRVALIRRSGRGGSAGYADRLERGLRALGVDVETRGSSPIAGWRDGAVRVALERVPFAHVYRAGGGVESAHRRALGRLGLSGRVGWDVAVARTAGVVIANSRLVADALIAESGVSASRIELVRTGVDPRFTPGAREPGLVLFAGHGWRRKGALVAAAAFASARRPGDRLLVAGADSRRGRRVAQMRARVPDLVDLGPWVDLVAVLPRVSVLLHPTRYDPASNLVIEAMACGVAPVTTALDGSAEIVPEPRLVARDPAAVGEVAAALRFALEHGDALGGDLVSAVSPWPDVRNHAAVAELARRWWDG